MALSLHALSQKAGDYSRCGEVVVESAYVKLCSGYTQEALSMFNEVRDTAIAHKNDFLSQVGACVCVCVCVCELSLALEERHYCPRILSRETIFRGISTE